MFGEGGAGAGRSASKSNTLKGTSHRVNVTDWSRHAPTLRDGIGYYTRHIQHFLHTGKREGRDEEEGKGEGKGMIDGRDT